MAIYHFSDPKQLLENERFQKFLSEELLLVIENTMGTETIMNWSKFIVYLKLDDPYLWPALSAKIRERMARFDWDELLVILVNATFSLTSEAGSLFTAVSNNFATKMNIEYNPKPDEKFLTEEDIVKVI